MIFPIKPSKLSHTKTIIRSKPQGSVNIQGRFFLPQALTSIPSHLKPVQTNTAPISDKISNGNENDKTANSF